MKLGEKRDEFSGMSQKDKLDAIISEYNVMAFMTDSQLAKVQEQMRVKYKQDRETMTAWLKGAEKGMRMVMQADQAKQGVADIKVPLVAQACIAFNSRAYPTFVKGRQIAQPAFAGDRTGAGMSAAKRVAEHINYTALVGIEGWAEELDRKLQVMPNLGMCYKKSWWNPITARIEDKLVMPNYLTLDNDNTKTLNTTVLTEEYTLWPNEIREREAIGIFAEGAYDRLLGEGRDKSDDYWKAETILEQHTWLDLDEDGIFEPYIVYMFKDSDEVVGVEPRFNENDVVVDLDTQEVVDVKATCAYTDYHFIPSFDGKFLSLGFGHLIGTLNSAVNTIMNQLIDAGSNANYQGGFISNMLNLGDGPIRVRNKFYIPVDAGSQPLANSIFPLPVREPSAVLFQLLGYIVDMAKQMSSTSDVMTGNAAPKNTPATTVLAMIEQGMVMMTAIYKRIYRSMNKEINLWMKMYRDNMTTDGKFRYGGGGYYTVKPEDYQMNGVQLAPVADPNMSSQIAMIAKAKALTEIMDQDPNINRSLIIKYYIDALAIDNLETDAILPADDGMSPAALEMKRANDLAERQLALEDMEQKRRNAETLSKMRVDHALIIEKIANAESKEEGDQIAKYKAHAEKIVEQIKALDAMNDLQPQEESASGQQPGATGKGAGMVRPMAGPSDNEEGDELPVAPSEGDKPGDVSDLRGPSGRARPPRRPGKPGAGQGGGRGGDSGNTESEGPEG